MKYTFLLKWLMIISIILFEKNDCKAQQEKIMSNVLSCWKVKDYKLMTVVALTEKEIKNFSKQLHCFKSDTLKFIVDTLYFPEYSVKKIDNQYLLDNYGMGRSFLNSKASTLFEIGISERKSKEKSSPQYTMLYDGEFLFFIQDGVIFRMTNNFAKPIQRTSQ